MIGSKLPEQVNTMSLIQRAPRYRAIVRKRRAHCARSASSKRAMRLPCHVLSGRHSALAIRVQARVKRIAHAVGTTGPTTARVALRLDSAMLELP